MSDPHPALMIRRPRPHAQRRPTFSGTVPHCSGTCTLPLARISASSSDSNAPLARHFVTDAGRIRHAPRSGHRSAQSIVLALLAILADPAALVAQSAEDALPLTND